MTEINGAFDGVAGYDSKDLSDEEVQVDIQTQERSVRTSIGLQPRKKGFFIGVVVVAGFAFLFASYNLFTRKMSLSAHSAVQEESAEEAEVEQVTTQPQSEESGTDKTRMALAEQAMDIEHFEVEPVTEPVAAVESLPPVPVAVAPPAVPVATPDPLQVWSQVQGVGSFGEYEPVARVPASSSPAQTQAVSPTTNTRLGALVASRQPLPSDAIASAVEAPRIDLQLERDFFNGGRTSRSIVAGSMADGTIQSPAIWSPSDAEAGTTELFVVTLSSPIADIRGQLAIPRGSELTVRIERVEPTGYVRMSGVSIIRRVSGNAETIPLQAGAVTIRGEGGRALLASQDDRLDPGGEIASVEAGLFVLGGVGRLGELLNRSDSVQTNSFSSFGSSSFSSSVDNGDTNVLGGLLEGGANAILPGIQRRSESAIDEALEREQLWVVESGTPVTVVFNREIEI